MSTPNSYGTHYQETEAILGSIFGEMDYVEDCLNDMDAVELRKLCGGLVALYGKAAQRLNMAVNELADQYREMYAELDRVLAASKGAL